MLIINYYSSSNEHWKILSNITKCSSHNPSSNEYRETLSNLNETVKSQPEFKRTLGNFIKLEPNDQFTI